MPQGSDEKGVSVCGIYSLQLMRMPMVELCTQNAYIGSEHLSFKAMFVFFVVSLDVLFLLDAWKAFYLCLSLH